MLIFSANFPPVISTEMKLQLTSGATSVTLATLTVTDANNDAITLSVVAGSVTGLAVDSTSKVVTLASVPDTFPFTIGIKASDGTAASQIEAEIKYCACEVNC